MHRYKTYSGKHRYKHVFVCACVYLCVCVYPAIVSTFMIVLTYIDECFILTKFCHSVQYFHVSLDLWLRNNPDSKARGANLGPIWSRQDPGGPHVGPMNFAIWVISSICQLYPLSESTEYCLHVISPMLIWQVPVHTASLLRYMSNIKWFKDIANTIAISRTPLPEQSTNTYLIPHPGRQFALF